MSDKNLFLVNQELKRFSKSNNFDLIALDEFINNMEINDYFDQLHTTIQGSEKIAMTLYPQLKKILEYEKNWSFILTQEFKDSVICKFEGFMFQSCT